MVKYKILNFAILVDGQIEIMVWRIGDKSGACHSVLAPPLTPSHLN